MRSASTPSPWCCRIVELAARVLPQQQRQRYALEFIAELYDQPRGWQFQHAVSILTHSWQLRTALGTDTSLGDIMTTNTQAKRPLLCRFGVHDWQYERNPESGETFQRCSRCGKDSEYAGGMGSSSGGLGAGLG